MKASYKQLKIILVSEFRNFGPSFIASKLVEFLLFDNFFPNLAKFWDLNIFLLFDFLYLNNFSDFLACSILFSPTLNLSTSLLLSFLLETGLLSWFLLETDLLLLFLLEAGLLGDPVVFSIEVNRAAILLKPWMNRQ